MASAKPILKVQVATDISEGVAIVQDVEIAAAREIDVETTKEVGGDGGDEGARIVLVL